MFGHVAFVGITVPRNLGLEMTGSYNPKKELGTSQAPVQKELETELSSSRWTIVQYLGFGGTVYCLYMWRF